LTGRLALLALSLAIEADIARPLSAGKATYYVLVRQKELKVNPGIVSPVVKSDPVQVQPNSEEYRTEWLTAEEAAEHLRIKTRTLLLWARQGKVKGYMLSGVRRHVWRFRQVDLDATLELPSVCPERMIQ